MFQISQNPLQKTLYSAYFRILDHFMRHTLEQSSDLRLRNEYALYKYIYAKYLSHRPSTPFRIHKKSRILTYVSFKTQVFSDYFNT